MISIEEKQKILCKKYSMPYQATNLSLKVGISKNLKNTKGPIHGLRSKEENGTSGWYFWSGEWSDDIDFFVPIHGYHLNDWSNQILSYLGLPEYEDVWVDETLLLS